MTASDDVLIGFYHGTPSPSPPIQSDLISFTRRRSIQTFKGQHPPPLRQNLDLQTDKMIKSHTKFIHDIRYSPSGSHFASVGTDSKIFIYDGGEGNIVNEFKEGVHVGTTLACAWSPDSKCLVTSGMDRTVRLCKSHPSLTLPPTISYSSHGRGRGNSQERNNMDPRHRDKRPTSGEYVGRSRRHRFAFAFG